MSHPAAGALKTMGRGTLSRQLVLRVTALVAIVAITLSALTTLALHGIMERQADDQLRTFTSQIDRRGDDGNDEPGGGRAPIGRQVGFLQYGDMWRVGDASRTVTRTGTIQTDSGQATLPAAAMAALERVPTTGTPSTVTLPEVGPYRIIAKTSPGGYLKVVGLPVASYIKPVVTLAIAAALLTLAAIVLAFLIARRVVENSLRPLQRLAATANTVSRLELDSGEVSVPVRVAPRDTKPGNEVGQVGQAFNHMLDNVEGALDARQRSETKVRQFVADASHELRNPLASIKGYAELTRRNRGELPEDTARALGRIESESERMSGLVEDLLLLARLDSGPNLTRAPVGLNAVLANAVSDAQVAGPDHQWTLTLPDAEVVALGDEHRLHQIVANLLANARTHTPAGTRVETSLAREAGEAVIRVTDDGPGIPPELRDRVFERFTRADASRARSGRGTSSTGLGLAIVQAVVQAHGGTASVESEPGRSTTFTLRVPLAPNRFP